MNINTFTEIASSLPPHIAVLMRGGTGVGKSSITGSIAKSINLPLIDVRGSTMSEGDTGGYPDIEGMKSNGVMTFCMPAWFIRACNEPVVLFLDELNRSLPAVQQSFFHGYFNMGDFTSYDVPSLMRYREYDQQPCEEGKGQNWTATNKTIPKRF